MLSRLGPGPVFFFELVQAARRWQTYGVRAGFIAGLLVSLAVAWAVSLPRMPAYPDLKFYAEIGEFFFYGVVGAQISLVLLAAPAFAAGSICLDKARGNLTHLLVTDLSSVEILGGKLAARLLPVLSMAGGALPVLYLVTWMGGIDPEALLGAFLVSLGVAAFGCTLAVSLSVWGHKTHEVLVATYLLLGLLLLAQPLGALLPAGWGLAAYLTWADYANPYRLAFAPYIAPNTVTLVDCALFLGGALAASALLAAAATARLRAVAARQEGRATRRLALRLPGHTKVLARLPGPTLDGNPVLWREWGRRRSSPWMRAVWLFYAVVAASAAAMALGLLNGRSSAEAAAYVNAFTYSIGLLLVSITSVTCLQEERVRGSLDVLLATPLPTWKIVWGKWWGAFRPVPGLVVVPMTLAGLLWVSHAREAEGLYLPLLFLLMLVYGAATTSLGLALATWVTRFGRAVALSVTCYVLVAAGPVFVALATMHIANTPLEEGIILVSPWFGPGMLTALMGNLGSREHAVFYWALIWIALYALAAAILYILTQITFDDCLGRTRSRHRPTSPARLRRESRS